MTVSTLAGHTLVASIDPQYKNPDKISRIISAGVTVFHVNLAFDTRRAFGELLQSVLEILDDVDQPIRGLAFESRGRIVRVGRMRNNCPIQLKVSNTIILTTDEAYQYCGLPEIVFVGNFSTYLSLLKLGDRIFVNGSHVICLSVVKILQDRVTCCVLDGGQLESYTEVVMPYCLNFDKLSAWEKADCLYAIKNKGNFLIIPAVSDPAYYHALRSFLNRCKGNHIQLLCSPDLHLLRSERQIANIIEHFDGVWLDKIDDEVTMSQLEFILKTAETLRKSMVLKFDQIAFEKLSNMDLLRLPGGFLFSYPDAAGLECGRQFLEEYIYHISDTMMPTAGEGIVDAIWLMNRIEKAKCLICVSTSGVTAKTIAQLRPPCPMLVVTQRQAVAKSLLLWKNLRPLVCAPLEEMKEYGLDYAKQSGWLKAGDLVYCCYNDPTTEFEVSYVPNEIKVPLPDE